MSVHRLAGSGGSADESGVAGSTPQPLECMEPPQLPKHVLKPGLYTAHYGPHGYEIVMLEYKIREITLVKVRHVNRSLWKRLDILKGVLFIYVKAVSLLTYLHTPTICWSIVYF